MVNRPPIYGDLEDGVGWLIIVLPTLSNSRIESIILSQLEKIQVSKTGSGKPLMDLGETHFWGPAAHNAIIRYIFYKQSHTPSITRNNGTDSYWTRVSRGI